MDRYLADISAAPRLTEEQNAELARKAAAGDGAAREKLVTGHLKLVVHIAHQYAGYGLSLADLIAEGNLGLIRAAELFNPSFGVKFTTYAGFWIKQRMHRAITNQARAVRIPVWKSQRLRKLARLHDDLNAELGRNASADELAERLGMSPEELESISGDRIEVQSLDAPIGEEEAALSHLLPDPNAPVPSERLTKAELIEEIIACMHDLDDRELQVLTLKFGLHGGETESFRQMSKRFGVSREWIRRIAELAMVKIHRTLSRNALPGDARARQRARVLERIRGFFNAPTPA